MASGFLGDWTEFEMERQDLLRRHEMTSNKVRFRLLILLVKLDLYPSMIYEGMRYPMARYHPEYQDWFEHRKLSGRGYV